MNYVLAYYIPNLSDPRVIGHLFLLITAGIVLFLYARQRNKSWLALLAIGLGLLLAVVPPVIHSTCSMSDGYGDFLRSENQVDLPDWYFAVFVYFDVEFGTLYALIGMVGGWLFLELGSAIIRHKQSAIQSGNRDVAK